MKRKKSSVKCKVSDGIRVCKVSTPRGRVMKLSSAVGASPPVNITLYSSRDCHWCKKAETKLRKTISSNLDDMINMDVVDIESDRFMKEEGPRVDTLPTIKIGNNMITGVPDEEQIWQHVFNAYKGA